MPCESYDPGYSGSYSMVKREIERRWKRRLDELTQHMCFLCGELVYEEMFDKYASPGIVEWWKKHSKWDRLRVSKAMRSFLSQGESLLNPDELTKIFIQRAEKVHAVSKYHKEWFKELAIAIHKEVSKKKGAEKIAREKHQKLIESAMKKLTKDEKKVLGIK